MFAVSAALHDWSSFSVGPSPALAVGWFGPMSVALPAAPVCWALVGSLSHRSVALGSCAPSPAGSSLEGSSGLVVQAPGVSWSLYWGSSLSLPVVTGCSG